MKITDFTAEELNLIGIYRSDTKERVISRISEVLPEIAESDMTKIARNVILKLGSLSEEEFDEFGFSKQSVE